MLRPFWRYFGGKWRATPHYPKPRLDTIIEPFAGAAGYALHYPERDVILVEKYPTVAEIWRWLIAVEPDEVRSIPLVDAVDDLPSWVASGARDLIGFSMNAATTSPRRRLSSGSKKLRDRGRKFYGWSEALRERVAVQVSQIKHWRIIEGSFELAPDVLATWFVDPPYQLQGKHYIRGQTIVCEGDGADWLPFRQLGEFKSGPISKRAREMIWVN